MANRTLNGQIEFDVTAVGDLEAEGEMVVGPGILGSFGGIQPGALVWFADAIATSLVLGGEQVNEETEGFPEAIVLGAHLLASRSEGTLTARATWISRDGPAARVRTTVRDGDDTLLLEMTSTHLPRPDR